MFTDNSDVLLQLLEAPPVKRPKVVIFVDSNLLTANSRLLDDIASFKKRHGVHIDKVDGVQILPSGEIVKNTFWQTDAKAPDFARCVDIHRKPGYDPCELFRDPNIPGIKLKLVGKLLKKKLGYRTLMDVIPLDNQLVKGSHGRVDLTSAHQSILMSSDPEISFETQIDCTDVYHIVLKAIG